MKKTALVVALGALTLATSVQANWYVQGDLGYSKVKFSAYSVLDETKKDPRISLGYDLGTFRLAMDYTHYGKFEGVDKGDRISAKSYGLGFSGLYDFATTSTLKPYAGVRLTQNVFKVENSRSGRFVDHTENKFGYGVIAGAQYEFAPKWSLNGGVEYNRLGKFEDTRVNQYGAKVGVRFDF